MVIYNMKLNNNKLIKFGLKMLFLIIIVLLLICVYRIVFYKSNNKNETCDLNPLQEINASNYTNILKDSHENIEMYIGKRIKFSGFVYRLYDFDDTQFVLGRNMIISSDYQAVVVGFLCKLNNSIQYKDGTWVEIEGTITRGEYHGKIPVVKITSIKETNIPNEEYVYPPDETYIQTSKVL